MLVFDTRSDDSSFDIEIPLNFDQRRRSRIKLNLADEEILISLPRGEVLTENDRLLSSCGRIARITLILEKLSVVNFQDPLQMARACYHLGNRHLPVEITKLKLYYQHDHTIDHLMHSLGFKTELIDKAFFPEPGAYAQGKYYSNDGHRH